MHFENRLNLQLMPTLTCFVGFSWRNKEFINLEQLSKEILSSCWANYIQLSGFKKTLNSPKNYNSTNYECTDNMQ